MKKHRQSGFTLVEIAIVLVIVGLMIGGLLTPLSMQLEQRKIAETQKSMEDAREALIGFAIRNGYLPCPAISASNGLEARDGNHCAGDRRSGYLPWATLGLGKLDGWNHLFRYSVTSAFSNSGLLFNLHTPRDITVATRDASGQLVAATGVNDIPAVIISHGKNGYGASNELGGLIANAATGNSDEQINAGSDTQFVSRDATDTAAAPGGAFDDIVVWLSPNILYNRMVAAQKLP
ncbi:type II secretion system protein [Duganella sp. BJB488]|uniref:type II secretion system protein n=1 Tax=unclassified Duganella TaxID=2636909 RepID=UPI000E347063|nr:MULTISPECIES: type II secretion system protein [unclassified Duganella]NVD74881.1 type II secretion system protein [Duganella sp. BJB1802]RFP21679.1 type II secretion system protein [Duganella sp. BJB489]RFP23472.1 type II secretion system protein [Duganella sp. BJB488]RFP38638.1 type II secretion system protein [Duganella sp. BJB480]